jgi:hypothetical protein
MPELVNLECDDCEHSPHNIYALMREGKWSMSRCPRRASCDVELFGTYACSHCGEVFDGEGLLHVREHESECPHNPKVRRSVLLKTHDPAIRSCGSCSRYDADGHWDGDCPHHDARRDCAAWTLSTDLFWQLPKDIKPLYRSEVLHA